MDHFSVISELEHVYFNVLKLLSQVPSHLDLKIKKVNFGSNFGQHLYTKVNPAILSNLVGSDFSHGFPWTFVFSLDLYFCIKLKNLKFWCEAY